MKNKLCTIPTALTLFRLGFALTVSPFLLLNYLPFQDFFISKLLAGMLLVLGITDFLDGYLARACHLETNLGKLLDPLADKCLVSGTLIIFAMLNKISVFWVILIIAREFLLNGMRTLGAHSNITLPVSSCGKWKATCQYIYLVYVVGTPWVASYDTTLGNYLLCLMLITTFVSAFLYCLDFYKKMKKVSHEL